MLELDHLTVSGDVTFGKNVSLKVCVCVCVCSIIVWVGVKFEIIPWWEW